MGPTLPTHPVPKPPHGLLSYKLTNGIKMILNRKIDSIKKRKKDSLKNSYQSVGRRSM